MNLYIAMFDYLNPETYDEILVCKGTIFTELKRNYLQTTYGIDMFYQIY